MNLKHNPPVEELQQLIASCHDEQNFHVLAVTHNCDVVIEAFPMCPIIRSGKYLFYFLFHPGHGYTGYSASRDSEWMNTLFEELNCCWAKGQTGRVSISIF